MDTIPEKNALVYLTALIPSGLRKYTQDFWNSNYNTDFLLQPRNMLLGIISQTSAGEGYYNDERNPYYFLCLTTVYYNLFH